MLGVAQCGGAHTVDAILAPIMYAIHRRPDGFPLVDEFRKIYIAKTRIRFHGPEVILGHTLRFRLDFDLREVELLHIEITAVEDLDGF